MLPSARCRPLTSAHQPSIGQISGSGCEVLHIGVGLEKLSSEQQNSQRSNGVQAHLLGLAASQHVVQRNLCDTRFLGKDHHFQLACMEAAYRTMNEGATGGGSACRAERDSGSAE